MKGTHLTLEDTQVIQRSPEEGCSKAQIARELGKSPSTITKEVRRHRKFGESMRRFRFCSIKY